MTAWMSENQNICVEIERGSREGPIFHILATEGSNLLVQEYEEASEIVNDIKRLSEILSMILLLGASGELDEAEKTVFTFDNIET